VFGEKIRSAGLLPSFGTVGALHPVELVTVRDVISGVCGCRATGLWCSRV
jgi:hypothetical protein